MSKKYRLVTRSDMDGLVCAVLLKHMGIIDTIEFVHPKDMQDGKIQIGPNDITTNLPFVEGVYLAFDHHLSETIRVGKKENHIIEASAPSAARVVFNYYTSGANFPESFQAMMDAVDKSDSANFSKEEILEPAGWVLLSFLMDARTGLGRFKDFRVSNYNLMMDLIDYCKNHSIDEILQLPDVKERVDLFESYIPLFKAQLERCSKVYKNLVVLDLRKEETVFPGNRFVIYALFPDANISIHVLWGKDKKNVVLAAGKSIFNKTSKTSIGELMLQYGGGGHQAAGTCQIDSDKAEAVLKELIEKINADG
ncbi:MAG: exopolyphosphatase [Spirochaetia bacterium]|nr:exopolyphosphatase [Spirochaetia bacterium]